jgi:hypothetical protein
MTGTELEIIPPERSEIAGSDAERQPSLQTTARTDLELLAVWLKSHVDGSPHTLRAYERIGRRFVAAMHEPPVRSFASRLILSFYKSDEG